MMMWASLLGYVAAVCVEEKPTEVEFNVSAIPCPSVVDFLTVHSENVLSRLTNETDVVGQVVALTHVIGSVANLRQECMTEPLRFVLMLFVKTVLQEMSTPTSGTPHITDTSSSLILGIEALVASLRKLPTGRPEPYYTHEQDGRMTTLEALRSATFNESTVDSCISDALVETIFGQGEVVLEIDAGPLAEYSRTFNDSGRVRAFAIDGSPLIGFTSGGTVTEIDTRRASDVADFVDRVMGGKVDWIWSSQCLDTAGHLVKPRRGFVLLCNAPDPIPREIPPSFQVNENLQQTVKSKCPNSFFTIYTHN